MTYYTIVGSVTVVMCTCMGWAYYRYYKFGGIMKILYFKHRKLFPPASSWDHPDKYLYLFGVYDVKHLTLKGLNGNIGAWHVRKNDLITPQALFLFCHGVKYSRGSYNRVQLYNMLVDLNYAVLTFDYRGYGDSEGIPSLEGLVEDTILAFNQAKKLCTKDTDIFIWGHSLGGGPALKAANLLTNDIQLKGVILDATFYNTLSMINYKAGKWLTSLLGIYLGNNFDQLFDNSNALKSLNPNIPVMYIHSIGDDVIPFKFCEQLYNESKNQRCNMFLITEHECGHNSNWESNKIRNYVEKFVNECKERKNSAIQNEFD